MTDNYRPAKDGEVKCGECRFCTVNETNYPCPVFDPYICDGFLVDGDHTCDRAERKGEK